MFLRWLVALKPRIRVPKKWSSNGVVLKPSGFLVAPLLTAGTNNIKVESGDIIFVTSGMTVYVSGKVKKAGAIPFHSGLHLTEALALSGGAERTANLRTVYILRNGKRIPVNLRRVIKGRIADTPLQQGDYIVVESRSGREWAPLSSLPFQILSMLSLCRMANDPKMINSGQLEAGHNQIEATLHTNTAERITTLDAFVVNRTSNQVQHETTNNWGKWTAKPCCSGHTFAQLLEIM